MDSRKLSRHILIHISHVYYGEMGTCSVVYKYNRPLKDKTNSLLFSVFCKSSNCPSLALLIFEVRVKQQKWSAGI